MKVADIMSRPVITIRPGALIAEAAQLMLKHRISGLPVLDAAGELVGIVTEGDLLRRAETGTERHHHWLEFLIAPGRFTEDYVRARPCPADGRPSRRSFCDAGTICESSERRPPRLVPARLSCPGCHLPL